MLRKAAPGSEKGAPTLAATPEASAWPVDASAPDAASMDTMLGAGCPRGNGADTALPAEDRGRPATPSGCGIGALSPAPVRLVNDADVTRSGGGISSSSISGSIGSSSACTAPPALITPLPGTTLCSAVQHPPPPGHRSSSSSIAQISAPAPCTQLPKSADTTSTKRRVTKPAIWSTSVGPDACRTGVVAGAPGHICRTHAWQAGLASRSLQEVGAPGA